jgi:hypothetical protein
MTARRALTLALVVAVALAPGGAGARPDWRSPLERAGIRFITARELKGLMDRGERFVLVAAPLAFVDLARPKRLGHPERLPADRDTLLVFYCGGPN